MMFGAEEFGIDPQFYRGDVAITWLLLCATSKKNYYAPAFTCALRTKAILVNQVVQEREQQRATAR